MKTTRLLTALAGEVSREVTPEIFFDQEMYTRDTGRLLRAANAVFIATFNQERGTPAPASTAKPIE